MGSKGTRPSLRTIAKKRNKKVLEILTYYNPYPIIRPSYNKARWNITQLDLRYQSPRGIANWWLGQRLVLQPSVLIVLGRVAISELPVEFFVHLWTIIWHYEVFTLFLITFSLHRLTTGFVLVRTLQMDTIGSCTITIVRHDSTDVART